MKKRLLSLLLALALLQVFLPADVSATYKAKEGACGQNLTWSLYNTGVLVISGTGPMTDYGLLGSTGSDWSMLYIAGTPKDVIFHIEIQSGVTSVGSWAFHGVGINADIDVELPSTVTSIGNYAFRGCNVKSIILPASVTQIGEGAFDQSRLTDVYYVGTQAQWNAVQIGSSNEKLLSANIHFNAAPSPISADERLALEDFLLDFSPYSSEYDCRNTAPGKPNADILDYVIGPFDMADPAYPGEYRQRAWAPDPKNRWDAYAKYSEEQTNWILKEILNCTDADIADMKSRLIAASDQKDSRGYYPNPYYLDGYYYRFLGGVGWDSIDRVMDVRFDGTYYMVEYMDREHLGDFDGKTRCAVLKLKTINGKKYWSLYYDGRDFPANMDFSGPQESAPDPLTGFVDTPKTAFYYDAVLWAVENDVTNGIDKTHFGPNVGCTRGQVVTFLWRAAGCPKPKNASNPFRDVKKGAFYYNAVLWAVEQGITKGMSADRFAPDATCTRGQIVTFLWRAKDSSRAVTVKNPFGDVSKTGFYYPAMLWAVENGVTTGMSNTIFAPDATCTRGQVVTFLYRSMQKK